MIATLLECVAYYLSTSVVWNELTVFTVKYSYSYSNDNSFNIIQYTKHRSDSIE